MLDLLARVLPPLLAFAAVLGYVYAPQAWGRRLVLAAVTGVALLVGVAAILDVGTGIVFSAVAWGALAASLMVVRRRWGPALTLVLAAALVGLAAYSASAFRTLPVLLASLAGLAAAVLAAAVAAARLKLRRRPIRA